MNSNGMKLRFASVAVALLAVGALALTGCGNDEKTAEETGAAGDTAAATAPAPAEGGKTADAAGAGKAADAGHEGHAHAPGEGHGEEGGGGGGGAAAGPMAGGPGGPMMGGGGAGGPMMGGGDLKPTPQLDAKIAEAEKKGDKKALGQALADRGYAKMMDEDAAPRVKYRAALADYRLALKADPNNAKAKENKKTIEDIYKSMGRPVPGEGE